MGWTYLGILLLISALLCVVGFYRYVYFLSIGYGFAVAGIGITLAVMGVIGIFEADITLYLLCGLLVIYGVRLSGFLLLREIKSAAYRNTMKNVVLEESKMPIFVKFMIWVSVSVLYVGQTCPVFYRIYNGQTSKGFGWAAIIICILALILESVADIQKTNQKKERPDMVAMKGLYKIVRCPNYLGEILFWTGIFVSGFGLFKGLGQWILAGISYICIVYVMFNGAQRLEKRQMKRYGDNEEYIKYADNTPILLPLLPIYHLNSRKEVKYETGNP